MKKVSSVFLALVIFCLHGISYAGQLHTRHTVVIDTPDEYHTVEVSLTDMNRIVCESRLGAVVFSKEKEVEAKQTGNSIFVKFLPVKKTTDEGIKYSYSKISRDIFVECGGRVFSLMFVPRKIPSVTIFLKTPWENIKKASAWERSRDYESVIIELIRSVYSGTPPDGYAVVDHTSEAYRFKEADVFCSREYRGFRFAVKICRIIAKSTVNLSEKEILKFLKQPPPVAVSIFEPSLKKGQKTTMALVYKRTGGSNAH